jgi:hypothetical protein
MIENSYWIDRIRRGKRALTPDWTLERLRRRFYDRNFSRILDAKKPPRYLKISSVIRLWGQTPIGIGTVSIKGGRWQ